MNRDPILFRLDATADKGYERLARCQILAMALQRRRRPTHFLSQLEVNPLLGPSREGYEFDPGSQLLLGSRYALVRPELRRQRPGRSQEPAPLAQVGGKPTTGQMFRALVALGEDDPHNRTL